MGRFSVFLFLAVSCALISTATNAQDFLSRQQVQRLFSGITVSHNSPRSGQHVVMRFRPGGSFSVQAGSRSDTGSWFVRKNGALCWQYDRMRGGRRVCSLIVRRGQAIGKYHPRRRTRAPGADWQIIGGG